jgi:two-component system nitrogen regulation sensor histidine kinase NtrY
VASGLATNYINSIFSPYISDPLHKSIEIAQAFYDLERERVLLTAREFSLGMAPQVSRGTLRRYSTLPEGASDIVREAFEGKEGTEVVSQEDGDTVRAAVPDRISGNRQGVVVVEMNLPRAISQKTGQLKDIYEAYLKLESLREPLNLNYVLILGFITLMMVFTGLWVSLKISSGITIPIQKLARATEQVSSGDLDVRVAVSSQDEIGLLTDSFNEMVRQLKDNKISLEQAYEIADKRRLYLENILENIDSGVLFLDSTGRIMTLNKAACSILEIRHEDIIGRDYPELIERLKSEDLSRLVRGMEGKQVRTVRKQIEMVLRDRRTTLNVRISAIRESETARALGMVVVFDDVTSLIQAQRSIAWQEMARRLAHEIKNPLTPIKLSTERLIKKWQQRDAQFDAVFEQSTKTIISEVESLRKLVDIFSRYGRLPAIQKVPIDLSELVDSVVTLFKGYSEVDVRVSLPADLPPVEVDPEQFKRVLINLVDNAIKAMNGVGVLTIAARVRDQVLSIDVADSGPGISDAEKEQLFVPYFSNTQGGTGLGLAIASKIMTDHGGRIIVGDNPPHGSVFTLEIPKSLPVEV